MPAAVGSAATATIAASAAFAATVTTASSTTSFSAASSTIPTIDAMCRGGLCHYFIERAKVVSSGCYASAIVDGG